MSKIHMETENVRNLARLLANGANEIDESIQQLRKSSSRLSMAWQGGQRSQRFLYSFNKLIKEIEKQVNELETYSIRINREIDEWKSVDGRGQKAFQGNSFRILEIGSAISAAYHNLIEFGKLDPYPLKDVINYLLTTDSGKQLEDLAKKADMCFILPDGTVIGEPNGNKYYIRYGSTSKTSWGYQSNNEIVISDDLPWQQKSTSLISGVLAHEMQHAIDRQTGVLLDYTGIEKITDVNSIEKFLEERTNTRINSEVRAFERLDDVYYGNTYSDDGITSSIERQSILNKGYEKTYEKEISNLLPDYAVDVRTDQSGALEIELVPIQKISSFKVI